MRSLSVLHTQRGGTLFGMIAGLLVGLVVAVLVAVYVTKAPVPFVNREPHVAAAPPVDPAAAPDPNRSLYGRDAPAGAPSASGPSTTEPAPPPVPDATRDPLGDFMAKSQNAQPPVAPPAAAQPPQVALAQPNAAPASPPAGDGSSYFLQVGAFRVIEDAESLRARLAFMGFEAHLEDSGTVHRVRLGPFAKLDDMNRTRSRLAENGIEAAVVKK
jgi:cell division protein FtsN